MTTLAALVPFKVLAIAGQPGAGKTTLANNLHEALGWPIISTGDIARRVDPEGLARGELADEAAFREAFFEAYYDLGPTLAEPAILDGMPRSRAQLDYLPRERLLMGLTCRIDIAIERQLRRGRAGDSAEIIEKRTREQSALLEVDHADGWLYHVAGWGAVVNTSQKPPALIASQVLEFLRGERRQMF